MNRRGFLKTLGVGTAAATGLALTGEVDLERLLWQPGQRTYFLPSPKVLFTIEEITREAARLFEAELSGGGLFRRARQFEAVGVAPRNGVKLTPEAQDGRTAVGVMLREEGGVRALMVAGLIPSRSAFTAPYMVVDENGVVETRHTRPSGDLVQPAELRQVVKDMARRVRVTPYEMERSHNLILPLGLEAAKVRTKSGLTVRGVRYYDIRTDRLDVRIDVAVS